MRGAALLAFFVVAGCAAPETPPPARAASAARPLDDWQRYASADDRRRLYGWRDAFTEGLRQARGAGHYETIDREGALFDPDAALAEPTLPAGDYRCRIVKLGTPGAGLPYVDYPFFRCRVTGDGSVQRFEKLTGSQRQVGNLYRSERRPDRGVFLGTLALGTETRVLPYGTDTQRDVIGALERIGERRWRILFPYPRFESVIDVMEIVPG